MAKILGQLEQAQLEQVTALPPTAPTGRVVVDVTQPLAAVPKMFNGTDWKTFLFDPEQTLIQQNSGKFCTVNWGLGLTQQVNLTDNCKISFMNPQEGQVHTLIVKQVQTDQLPYSYVLDMIDQEISRKGKFQPSPPPVRSQNVHQWFYELGLKPATPIVPISTSTAANASILGVAAAGIDFAPDDGAAFLGRSTTPFWWWLNTNDKGKDQFRGNFLFNPSVAAVAAGNGPRISPDGGMIAVPSFTTPFIQVAGINQAKTFAAAYWANPVTLPVGGGTSCSWHPTSNYLAVGHQTSPFLSVYPMTGSQFGTKLADPGALPVGVARTVEFAPTGDYIAMSNQVTPFLEVWEFNGISGVIGAKVAAPNPIPVSASTSVQGTNTLAWRPQADFIAMTTTSTPFIYVVPFDRSTSQFGTPLSITGAAIPPGTCRSVRWSRCGGYLIVGCDASPFALVYDFSGHLINAPMPLGSSIAIGVTTIVDHQVTYDNEQLLIGTGAVPWLWQLQMPNQQKNYLRLL